MSFRSLLRPLIPSWRFFDRVEQTTRLHFRLVSSSNSKPEWQTLRPPPAGYASRLFFNPRGNLALGCQSLVDRLVEDINQSEKSSDITSSASYRLVENIVRVNLREQGLLGPFQFKISVVDAKTKREIADSLVSSEISA